MQVLGVDYLLGTDDGWPYLLGIAVFPSILQLILLPICPESPRYLLISKGQEQAAREALKRLRNTPHIEASRQGSSAGKRSHVVLQDDIDEMRAEELAQQAESQITMLELVRSPSLRMPLTIAIVMQLSQQVLCPVCAGKCLTSGRWHAVRRTFWLIYPNVKCSCPVSTPYFTTRPTCSSRPG